MSQNPQSDAEAYGLSKSVTRDLEDEDGPPSGAQHGRTNTNPREDENPGRHGPKTLKALREQSGRRR